MEHKSTPRRIGVVDQSSAGWTAAGTYSQMTMRSLASVCEESGTELYFLSRDEPKGERVNWIKLDRDGGQRRRGEARLRYALHLDEETDPFSVARKRGLDVLLPLLDVPPWKVATRSIGWIPDFQHVHLPEFFDAAELEKRNATVRRLVTNATLIMLSSEAAREDFRRFAPEAAHKARVSSFPSLMAFANLSQHPEAARIKFNLPEKFALVANQFWVHKNHKLVVAALTKLRDEGIIVPTVMTGLPVDHRDRDNSNFSSLLQEIARAGLNSDITILGQVPYSDLIDLMRSATVIIQPSRFEGWSTVVQDGKALGRPLICSDIAVHREQAPGALGFFGCDAPDALAGLLANQWTRLGAGPDAVAEAAALAGERNFALKHGKNLIDMCAEACAENSNG